MTCIFPRRTQAAREELRVNVRLCGYEAVVLVPPTWLEAFDGVES